MLDIEAIKARLAAATPGPWQTITTVETDIGTEHLVTEADMDAGCIGTSPQAADAELIANAPTDLAALIAEVDRLHAAITTHRQEQGEAVTKSAMIAADRRLWEVLPIAEVERMRAAEFDEFDEFAVVERVEAIRAAAEMRCRIMPPDYTTEEKAAIEAYRLVAEDHGWNIIECDEGGGWRAFPIAPAQAGV